MWTNTAPTEPGFYFAAYTINPGMGRDVFPGQVRNVDGILCVRGFNGIDVGLETWTIQHPDTLWARLVLPPPPETQSK